MENHACIDTLPYSPVQALCGAIDRFYYEFCGFFGIDSNFNAKAKLSLDNVSSEGETVIKGVKLPLHVVQELRREGIALSWYTATELQAAIEACAYDGKLIEDPNGMDFYDKLALTWDEVGEELPSPFPIPPDFLEAENNLWKYRHMHLSGVTTPPACLEN